MRIDSTYTVFKGWTSDLDLYTVLEINVMAWLIGLVFVVLAAAITETYGQTGLTAAQKQQFVDAHNALRKSVKPAATNMKTMVHISVTL